MRAVCITFEPPTSQYGGGLGIIQTLTSVSASCEIDYVGPTFEKEQFPQFNIRKAYFLREITNPVVKAYNLLRGVVVRYNQPWLETAAQLDTAQYDAAVVDFSYNDFVVRWARTHGLKTIVRVHNIESDMVKNTVASMHLNRYWLRFVLNGRIIRRREKKAMQMADRLIFLTQNDLDRACALYGQEIREKAIIVPVCLKKPESTDTPIEIREPYLLTTASLYGTHAKGIEWFLRNVWAKMQSEGDCPDVKYVVAGRRPEAALRDLCAQTPNCILVESPEQIGPYFKNAQGYIAPIFTGAGMKVKIAEALSYGLRTVGTTHALIGYDVARQYCFTADTPEAFRQGIREILAKDAPDMHEECVRAFEDNYEMGRSCQAFSQILVEIARPGK